MCADRGDRLVELQQFVEGSSRLKSADLLQVLTFEVKFSAACSVGDGGAGEQRSAVDVLADALVGSSDGFL